MSKEANLIDAAIQKQAREAGGQDAEIAATAYVVFERLVELGLPRSAQALAETHAAVGNAYHDMAKAVVLEGAKAAGLKAKDFAPDFDYSPKTSAQRKALLGYVAAAVIEAGAVKLKEHERKTRRKRQDMARQVNEANR